METVISIFLTLLGAYFLVGVLFALYFVFVGATRLDPLMKETKQVVRVLLFPGVIATWPFLLRKLLKSKG